MSIYLENLSPEYLFKHALTNLSKYCSLLDIITINYNKELLSFFTCDYRHKNTHILNF